MKFRFCGDGDCPDWVLAEINSTLSVLSAVKLRIVTQLVAKSLLGDAIPEDRAKKSLALGGSADNSNGEADPLKSAFACCRFLLVNAVRYGADDAAFGEELQQLGLPKEHAAAICRVRQEEGAAIEALLAQRSLTVNQLTEFSCSLPAADQSIDCATMHVRIANELGSNGRSRATAHSCNISRADVALLLDELRTIERIMAETAPEPEPGLAAAAGRLQNGGAMEAAAANRG